jgi:glucose/arabinose dehydrogenase
MLSRRVALFAVPLLAIVAPVVACGDESAVNAGGGGTADGGATTADGAPNLPSGDGGVKTRPTAKGDPCRGQPLPDDEHFVASGLCARLVSASNAEIRQLMFAPNGDLFGQSNNGKIWLYRDADDDGFFTKAEIHEWATTGNNGNNAHVDVASGFVYAGSNDGVKRFAYDPAALEGGPAEDVVVNQPGGGHAKHTTHVYDGFLYVHSGSVGNATHESGNGQSGYDTDRSLIKRFDLSKFTPGTPFEWSAGEAFTLGLRNVNGFTRNETTKKIYGVVNGLDEQRYKGADVHNDNPGEQVLEIAANKRYGYPFCFTAQRVVDNGNVVPVGTQLINTSYASNPHDDAWCAQNSDKPTTFVQAHSAPLDLAFFDEQAQGALPEKYRGGAFIALHGSWNRSPPTGYRVVWQPFNADGTAPQPTSTAATTTFPYEVIFGGGTVSGGHEDKAWAWSSDTAGEAVRPAGVAVSPIDGALYIASDTGGLVYRIGIKK